MASHHILVVGDPSPLSRELLADGHIVQHAPMNRSLWTALASGVWDACVFEEEGLCAEVYDLIQHARESQPDLALLVATQEESSAFDATLVSGADDWLKAESRARPAARVLAQAIAFRRSRARTRPAAPQCHVLMLSWDQRTFARIDSQEVTLVDLNECVVSACKIAFSEIRQRAHLIQALSEVPHIPGSRGKLAQVVTNLLVNAAQAIPEGNVEAHRVTVRTGQSGGEVWLQVEDTGRGIAPQIRARIFDPFFTTKARSQSTGLGLALCVDIVRQHQGSIRAMCTPDGGTCFEVRLPLDTQLQASAPAPIASQVVPRVRKSRRLRVLLIDDEPLVLRSLRRMLSEHHVDTAQSGSEALQQLQRGQDYDLIFCDLMMPEMDGTVVHAEIERRMPALLDRLVFCSGGAFTARTKQFLEQTQRPLVEKPLTRESFERVVSEQLGERRLRVAGDA